MRLQTKYFMLKATTIFFGALSIPWSTFTGYCFGDGRYFTGIVSLAAQTIVALIDGYIWFWVLENMKNKIQEGTKPSEPLLNSRREFCPFLSVPGKRLEGFPTESHAEGFTADQNRMQADPVTNRLSLEKSFKPETQAIRINFTAGNSPQSEEADSRTEILTGR